MAPWPHSPTTSSPVGMPSCLEPRPKPCTTCPRQKNGRLLMTPTSGDAGCCSLRGCGRAAVSASPGPGPAGDPAEAGLAERDTHHYRYLPAEQPTPPELSGRSAGTATAATNLLGFRSSPAIAPPLPLRPRPEPSPSPAPRRCGCDPIDHGLARD